MIASSALATWPRRRRLVAAASAVLIVLGQLIAAPDDAPLPAWWWAATLATSTLAGAVLASYVPVPGSGRRVDVGCTPCAMLAGGLAAFALLGSLGKVDAGSSLIAFVLVVAGLYQRTKDAETCRAPSATHRVSVARANPIPRQENP